MSKIGRLTHDKRTKRTGCQLGVEAALLAALVGDGGRHMRYDAWTGGWGRKLCTLDMRRDGHQIGAQTALFQYNLKMSNLHLVFRF